MPALPNDADERKIVEASLDRLRVFPLPSSVLVPGGHLPLHIFEPRYRSMVADCLASDRVLAVALLEPGWEADYHGRPDMAKIVGAGFVQGDEKLPDGRYNILLHGVMRVRIVEELPANEPYRIVRAVPYPDVKRPGSELLVDAGARTLRQLVVDLAGALPDNAGAPLADACVKEKDPGKLADIVGAAVLVDHRLRQEFLEETDVGKRLDLVSETVAQVLLQVSNGAGGGYVM